MKGWDYGLLYLEYKWAGWENDRLNEWFGLGQAFERVNLSDLNRLYDSTNTDLGGMTRRNSLRYLAKDGCNGYFDIITDLLRIYVGQCGYY